MVRQISLMLTAVMLFIIIACTAYLYGPVLIVPVIPPTAGPATITPGPAATPAPAASSTPDPAVTPGPGVTPSPGPVLSIRWAGHVWTPTDYIDATYDTNQVWVDANGWLHMKLIYDNGKWHWMDLLQQDPAHYGTYTYVVDTDVHYIQDVQDGGNPYLDCGMFLYDDNLPHMDFGEIDTEFAKWGATSGTANNMDWTLHQASDVVVRSNHFVGTGITYTMEWTPERIQFSAQGPDLPYTEFTYADASKIPPDTGTMEHILEVKQWQNHAPPDNMAHYECEFVLRNYTYTPYAGNPA